MSDFIDLGTFIIRKEDIVGVFEKEDLSIEILLNKSKYDDNIITLTSDTENDFEWMRNYLRMCIGLPYSKEVISQ